MDAAPMLEKIAEALEKHGLEAVLIGNAAAALQGAPVTTVDFDFFFRKTPANLKKLKRIAADLGAIALHPYYPASGLIRLMRDDDGLQLDFMNVIDGVPSFEGLRRRSLRVQMGAASLRVAPLADKKAAGSPRDLAAAEPRPAPAESQAAPASPPPSHPHKAGSGAAARAVSVYPITPSVVSSTPRLGLTDPQEAGPRGRPWQPAPHSTRVSGASLVRHFINTVSYFERTTPSRSRLRSEPRASASGVLIR